VTKVDPKCLEKGKITYTVSFENPDFETQTFVEVLPQTGHHYGEVTYSWNLDHSECTASHTCTCGHIESETAYSTNVRVEPECEKAGSITYTANFDNVNFETQTYLEVLPQTGHHYGEVTYSWNDDYSECTASYTCACGYINKEIVSTTNVKVDPKCLEKGKITYTASFENPDFKTQTFVETLPQTGHHYGEVTYSWNLDHSECTASHSCTCGHIESETAYSTNVRVEQECEKAGSITYTANFDNVNFKTQTYIETLPQTGHHYGEVIYTWNDDHSTCTASHTCACGHIESETVISTNVRVEPICETDGSITYTASFDNEDFDEQKFVEIIPQTGHTYNDISYSWNDDYSECTATMKCSCGDINKVTVKTTINRVEPKCVEDGSITYVASFDDERLVEQKHVESIAHTGHHYGEVTYTWNDEFSTCTASHKCECGHVESETVNTTNERIEPKCLEDGLVTYTAIFVNEKFVQQSHEIAIPQTGHHYGEPVYSWNDDHLECIARKTCNCGENIEEIAKINIAEVKPNCQKAGSITISAIFETAGFFEQVYVIEIPKIEHEHGEVVIENYLDSSCSNPGSYDEVVYCKLCGEELSRITKTIEKKSHTFGEWFTIKEPTYFEVGQERRDCLDCDEYEVRDIKKLDISILFKEQVSSIHMANDSLDELFVKIKEALATYECVDDKAKVVDEYETLLAYKNAYLNLVEDINSEYEDAKNIERNFFVGIGILGSMISLSKVMYIFRKRWF